MQPLFTLIFSSQLPKVPLCSLPALIEKLQEKNYSTEKVNQEENYGTEKVKEEKLINYAIVSYSTLLK